MLKSKDVFSEDEIREIKKVFRQSIQSNRRMLGDTFSRFHLSWCSAILATYRVCLKKGMSEAEAIDFSETAIFENMHADEISARVRQTLDKARDPFRAIVNASKHQERHFFGNTFSFSRNIDDENHYLAVVQKCFYNDFFRANGSPQLMKIACKWDFISWGKAIIPERHGLTFSRPVTLGLDGGECPFSFDRRCVNTAGSRRSPLPRGFRDPA
jgi:hypothetical protein